MKKITPLFLICLISFLFLLLSNKASAVTLGKCVAECQTDVMYVSECIAEEKSYWDLDSEISEKDLKQACIDLIRNERLRCYSVCIRDQVESDRAVIFYDTEVRFFPNRQD